MPNRGVLFGLTSIKAIMEAVELAEESRVFESVWFGDSLIHKPRLESVVMLSAVASRGSWGQVLYLAIRQLL